ncbi:alpha/beta fold hydrolase [Pseudomonas soli]|uniref:alpha/beta fold hydrolase n=1 Tax=Pseudomonas soli TaxID=1306993 RepID=UPI003804782A
MDTQLASLIERLAKPSLLPMRPTESRHLATLKTEVVTCGPYRSRVLVYPNHDPQAKSALLLHGWGGHPMMLSEVRALLQDSGYRVYMPFLLGHDPQSPASCDFPGQCPLLLALQVRYGPFDSVVAHSAGGIIMAMAHWQGLILDRVALLSAPASLPSLLQHALSHQQIGRHHLASLDSHYQSRYPMPASLNTAHPYTFSGARALIMHGNQDQRIAPADAGRIHAQLPDSQLLVVEGTGHLGILSHPRTRQALARFLCRQNTDHEKGHTYVGAY